jgi:hypothetical protein
MTTHLLLIFTLSLCGGAFAQSDIPCTAGTPIQQQSRTRMKHRGEPSTVTPSTVNLLEMLTWKAPAKVASSPAVRKSNTPIDPKETQAFTLEGDLWRIQTEANDCDFHMELAAPGAGPTADRVIVEIPQDSTFTATRKSILKKLADEGVQFPAPIMTKPIRVHVTGFAFYDAFHFSNADPQRGRDHGTAFVGTLWELHPVWSVGF